MSQKRFELPVKENNKPVQFGAYDATIFLQEGFRIQQRKMQELVQEYQAAYRYREELQEDLLKMKYPQKASALVLPEDVNAVKADDVKPVSKEALEAEIAKITEAINTLDQQQFNTLVEQIKPIIYATDKTTPVENVDWPNAPIRVLKEISNFFWNSTTPSSNE